eukprot:207659-Pyramimonas_sp.AAC.1
MYDNEALYEHGHMSAAAVVGVCTFTWLPPGVVSAAIHLYALRGCRRVWLLCAVCDRRRHKCAVCGAPLFHPVRHTGTSHAPLWWESSSLDLYLQNCRPFERVYGVVRSPA